MLLRSGAMEAQTIYETWRDLQAHLKSSGLQPGDPSISELSGARARHETYLLALGDQEDLDGEERWLSLSQEPNPLDLLIVTPRVGVYAECGILYLRGAGWWGGTLTSSRPVVHRLARESGLVVCAVDYRRIPEHAFPAQRDDVLSALFWLGQNPAGVSRLPNRWIIWGESAGASLAVCAATVAEQDPGLQALVGLVLLYGNHAGPHEDSGRSRWIWKHYLAGLEPGGHSMAIPALNPGFRLPPTLLAVGSEDALAPDSQLLHRCLLNAGVPSTLIEFPGLPHSFTAMASILRPAQQAFSRCAAHARSMATRSASVSTD